MADRRAQREALPEFCKAMGSALADLVRQVSPVVTTRDVAELPLLTLGSFFQGQNNNRIGQIATTRDWFDAAQVLGRRGKDWEEFRRRIAKAVGVPHN